jgi:hypothetical protein
VDTSDVIIDSGKGGIDMAYTGVSIVDYLKSIGQDSSFANRKKLAAGMGIQNYMGTAEQNTQMLNAMRNKSGGVTKAPSNDVIKEKVISGTNPAQGGTTGNIVGQNFTNNNYGQLPGTYEKKYDPETQALVDKILNYGPFVYNPNTDPLFQSYAGAYMREGERAYQDTIGDLAAVSGDGMPSSWAVSAASQAKNAYSQKLMDVIPQLEGQAYNRYLGGLDILKGNLGTLQGIDATEYGRYRDLIGDFENNRNFNRGVFESDRAYDYQVSRDKVLDDQWMKQFDYNKQQDIIRNALQSRQISVSEANTALDRAKFNYQREQDEKNQMPTAGQLDSYNQIVAGLSKDPAGALGYIDRLGKKFYTDLIGEDLYNQLLSEAQSGFKGTLPKSSFSDDDYYKRASDMLNATIDIPMNDPNYDNYPNGKKPKYTDQQVIDYVMGLPIDSWRKADILNALGI